MQKPVSKDENRYQIDLNDSENSFIQILQDMNTPHIQPHLLLPEDQYHIVNKPSSDDIQDVDQQAQEAEEYQEFIKILKQLNYPVIFPDYSSKLYWNTRYSDMKNVSYEWIQPFSSLRSILLSILQLKGAKSEILYIGCGNSDLGLQLYQTGYKCITQIDFSEVAVKRMQERCQGLAEINTHEMDATSLTLNDELFDLIIEKGTLDAILTGKRCLDQAFNMISEVWRCLKVNGYFISVSHGDPANRRNYFDLPEYNWQIRIVKLAKPRVQELEKIDESDSHYLYICNKLPPDQSNSQTHLMK